MKTQAPLQIILVEDHDADAELITRALRKANLSIDIVRLRDGRAALDFITGTGLPDAPRAAPRRLVLLDVNLPEVGGIEVLRQLRTCEATATLPIVMLTGSTAERDRIETDELGVNMYLVKPVAGELVVDMVHYAEMYWDSHGEVP